MINRAAASTALNQLNDIAGFRGAMRCYLPGHLNCSAVMKSSKIRTTQNYSIVTVTITTIAIALSYGIFNSANTQAESHGCKSFEVFRWSDRTCYVPQGE